MTDISINGSGTLYMVGAVSEDGLGWMTEHVVKPDYAPDYPNNIPVEHRYIEDLTLGALRGGLEVELNGEPVEIGDAGDVVIVR